MTDKKETAEQKLLKMIEGTTGVAVAQAEQKKIKKTQNTLTIIKTANKILFLVLIFIVVWLGGEVVAGIGLLGQKMEPDLFTKRASAEDRENAVTLSAKDVSYYVAAVSKRNFFQPYADQTQQNIVYVSDKNRHIAQVTAHLKLVGVSWLDRPETASVMLEDANKKSTYFLMQGEKVDNITVKTIYADSVLLGYENEEIIIRYDKSQM